MMNDAERAALRDAVDRLAGAMPGYAQRRGQLTLMGAVGNAMANGCEPPERRKGPRLCAAECGTGTGKSAGALLPALIVAHSRGKRVVVATSTVALQEQLVRKDLPLLRAAVPFPVHVAVLKGRRRYVCPLRLAEVATGDRQDALPENVLPIDAARQREARETAVRLQQAFDDGTWAGEQDDAPEALDAALWESLTTDRSGCLGRRCAQYARCPLYRARDQAREASVVVTNHDVLLACVALDEDVLLPPAGECLYIVDEAHGLARRAVTRLAARHTVDGVAQWLERVRPAVGKAALVCGMDDTVLAGVARDVERLGADLGELRALLGRWDDLQAAPSARLGADALPQWLLPLGQRIAGTARCLNDALEECMDALRRLGGDTTVRPHRLLAAIGAPAQKVEEVARTWEAMLACATQVPLARWAERFDARHGPDFAVCVAPLTVGAVLDERLWGRICAGVVMSATLTGCGSISLFLDETGLDLRERPRVLRVASPFDYGGRTRLLVPPMASSPKDAAAHTAEAVAMLPALIQTAGTLILCNSVSQLRAVERGLPADLRKDLLVQGRHSKQTLLALHRAAIDAGRRSVLVGLQSLAEGIDLPGEYTTHVILMRCPFRSPAGPLEQARAEWVEANGGCAFRDISLPEAGIRLAQAAGRLMRTEDDYGTVTILDTRMARTRWGRQMLRSLPPFELCLLPPDWATRVLVRVEPVGQDCGRKAA